mmetsp:Transcript_7324/g.18726  ORF Transcript_7324/g.18726 Transcript_7324/m.18726 type:complete len:280 (+) Transcript_7324:74-913(+)
MARYVVRSGLGDRETRGDGGGPRTVCVTLSCAPLVLGRRLPGSGGAAALAWEMVLSFLGPVELLGLSDALSARGHGSGASAAGAARAGRRRGFAPGALVALHSVLQSPWIWRTAFAHVGWPLPGAAGSSPRDEARARAEAAQRVDAALERLERFAGPGLAWTFAPGAAPHALRALEDEALHARLPLELWALLARHDGQRESSGHLPIASLLSVAAMRARLAAMPFPLLNPAGGAPARFVPLCEDGTAVCLATGAVHATAGHEGAPLLRARSVAAFLTPF